MTLLKIGDLLCELHSEVNFRVLFKGLVPPRGNLKLFAPWERHVYSHRHSFKYSSLREERNWFQADSAAGGCAPTEREPNSVTQSIDMSPRRAKSEIDCD